MLSQAENDLLTQVGPGTPAGNLFRRYWHPVALSRELPDGAAPLAVRLLGEDLTLFRDELGRLGLLGLNCSHRRSDLSYGRVEDGGPQVPLPRLAVRRSRAHPGNASGA